VSSAPRPRGPGRGPPLPNRSASIPARTQMPQLASGIPALTPAKSAPLGQPPVTPPGCMGPATDAADLYPVDQLKKTTASCRACLHSAAPLARQPAEVQQRKAKGAGGAVITADSARLPVRGDGLCLATTSIDHHHARGAAGAQNIERSPGLIDHRPAAAKRIPSSAPKLPTRRRGFR